MPPKMKKIEKIDHSAIRENLSQLRNTFKLDGKSSMCQSLYKFVKEKPYIYETVNVDCDDVPCEETELGNPFPISIGIREKNGIKDFPDTLDPELNTFLRYLRLTSNIDLNKYESVEIKIYPPAKKVSSFLNEIPFAGMRVSNRFIIPIGSDENVSYKMMNMKSMSSMMSMSIPEDGYEVPESVERWKIYHFAQMTALSICVRFDNLDSYKKFSRFSREGGKIERKLPLNRYMMVVDFRSTAEESKNNFTEYVIKLKDMASKGDSQGKKAEEALKTIKEQLSSEGVDISDIVDIPDDAKPSAEDDYEEPVVLGEPTSLKDMF